MFRQHFWTNVLSLNISLPVSGILPTIISIPLVSQNFEPGNFRFKGSFGLYLVNSELILFKIRMATNLKVKLNGYQ